MSSATAERDTARPLTAREEAAGRLHAAVLDRLAREGIPIPPEPDDDQP